MRILNSCVIQQVLNVNLWTVRSKRWVCFTPLLCAALYFCSCELRRHSTECVLLPCFNALLDIFAVMNCSVLALSAMFCSSLLSWSASVTHCTIKQSACRIICVVWKREYNVIFWRHKQRISSNHDHHTPLLNTRIGRGRTTKQSPWASPDLCTPHTVPH